MKIVKHQIPFFIVPVENHTEIKKSILDSISSMGIHSKIEPPTDSLSNTDWHLSSEFNRPYFQIVTPVFNKALEKVQSKLQIEETLVISNYWFQQYEKGDFHSWHTHSGSHFSAVYYVELEGSPKTTYRCMGKEFTIDVREGDILFAPGFFEHESKENLGKRKTVIVHNLVLEKKY